MARVPGSAWEPQSRLAQLMRALGGRALFWATVWIQSRFWYRADWAGRDAAPTDTFATTGR